MQSDGNSFIGDGVLDSFKMSYRDEDSILDQKYESKYYYFYYIIFYYEDQKFWEGLKKIQKIQHITTRNS